VTAVESGRYRIRSQIYFLGLAAVNLLHRCLPFVLRPWGQTTTSNPLVATLVSLLVICLLNGAEYVKRLDLRGGQIHLSSENPRYPPIPVDEEMDAFRLVGVVLL